jgi:hypothetical protein
MNETNKTGHDLSLRCESCGANRFNLSTHLTLTDWNKNEFSSTENKKNICMIRIFAIIYSTKKYE